MKKLAIAALMMLAINPTFATEKKKVYQAGAWQVMQTQDPMTDKIGCTGIYNGDWTVQANQNVMYVSLSGRGGVRAYTLRIGDEPADKMKLASQIEKKISAVILDRDFERILAAKRVMVQTYTILDTVVLDDVSLDGFQGAINYMRTNNC